MQQLIEMCKDIKLTWTWQGLELQVEIIDGKIDYFLADTKDFKILEDGESDVKHILELIGRLNRRGL